MCFVTPSNPNIILIGVHETQIYGFGEQKAKLCIYTKSIFDIGGWKEHYLTDVNVVKCECCKNGLHVATCLITTEDHKEKIWIAARENRFTHMFLFDGPTKEFIRFEMLEDIYPEFALLDLNLCSKCLSPTMRYLSYNYPDVITLLILPQKYENNMGIFEIRVSINISKHCLLWKKMDSYKLVYPPVSSNILVNINAQQTLSVIDRSEDKYGRIRALSVEDEDADTQVDIAMNEWLWNEVAFCEGLCLSRQRQEDGKSILDLYGVNFLDDEGGVGFSLIDYCAVDANFPSIDSALFFVAWRKVDKEYISKPSTKKVFSHQVRIIPSFIVAQPPNGNSIITIPLRILSLSESAYLSLSRIPHYHPLPVAQITCIHYFIRRIHHLLGLKVNVVSKKKEDLFMSTEYIKKKIGWPKILPLTNAPKLPMNSK